MKGINEYLDESKQALVSEVQNEYDKDYAYQTFVYDAGQKKFEYGFLTYNKDQEFYSVTALNKDCEFAWDFAFQYHQQPEDLFDLEIGESIADKNKNEYVITRIW